VDILTPTWEALPPNESSPELGVNGDGRLYYHIATPVYLRSRDPERLGII
jgi:hypothetical protein